MKQLEADPWEGVEFKYPAGAKFKGRVTNITDYGAFVELEPGVEGLVHVSEMSWTKKNVHPGKIVSTSQEVEVMVLDVDPTKRRISLGLKQTLANPWEAFLEEHPPGSEIEGEVRNTTARARWCASRCSTSMSKRSASRSASSSSRPIRSRRVSTRSSGAMSSRRRSPALPMPAST
jgi:ribosomal protein S1